MTAGRVGRREDKGPTWLLSRTSRGWSDLSAERHLDSIPALPTGYGTWLDSLLFARLPKEGVGPTRGHRCSFYSIVQNFYKVGSGEL